jgi:uncharacterized protein (DUF302 family)
MRTDHYERDPTKEIAMNSSTSSTSMRLRLALAALALAPLGIAANATAAPSNAATPVASADGVIRLRSMHGVDETVARVKAAVAAKGVRFFDAIDQQALGQGAGLTTRGSTLVLFGNPPLGVQFLQANPYAGLDWPVRMLVVEDADGSVWLAWTDFKYIARRYHITSRAAQFKMASGVAASIASDAAQ